MLSAYFADPSREARLADRLEEEVVHHGMVLRSCNTSNANMVTDVRGSRYRISAPTLLSIPSVIIGN